MSCVHDTQWDQWDILCHHLVGTKCVQLCPFSLAYNADISTGWWNADYCVIVTSVVVNDLRQFNVSLSKRRVTKDHTNLTVDVAILML